MNQFLGILIFLPSMFLAVPICFAQDSFSSPEGILSFADWLYQQGEYVRAAGEYYRYLFIASDKQSGVILRKIGQCYFKAHEYLRAIDAYGKLVRQFPSSSLIEEAYYESAYCYFKLGDYANSSGRIRQYGLASDLNPPFLLLDSANRLLAGDWEEAAVILNQYLFFPDALDSEKAQELKALTEEIADLPWRSPVLAGFLSGIIPGLGKLYAGRVEDGIVSFVLVGLLGGMAVYSFLTEGIESVTGWLYTSLGGVFYLGDVWGSAVAADQFNAEQKEQIKRKVKTRVQVLFP